MLDHQVGAVAGGGKTQTLGGGKKAGLQYLFSESVVQENHGLGEDSFAGGGGQGPLQGDSAEEVGAVELQLVKTLSGGGVDGFDGAASIVAEGQFKGLAKLSLEGVGLEFLEIDVGDRGHPSGGSQIGGMVWSRWLRRWIL